MRKCPICGKEYYADLAEISRVDKTALICPICHLHEALDEIDVPREIQAIILNETERGRRYERF